MNLFCETFQSGEAIPVRHTCDGENLSPPLRWDSVPPRAQSLVLIMDDPDGPGVRPWAHWLLYALPADTRRLPQAFNPADRGMAGIPGRNDFGDAGYGGPCPPPGPPHTYFIRLYALDTMLDLHYGANRQQLIEAMEGHILEVAEMQGTYQRDTG